MRILGVDYGSKRVGLALSDEQANLAYPHSVVPTTKARDTIIILCEREGVDTVVLGESKDYKGNDNVIAPAIKQLAEDLKAAALEVIMEPEVLTSAAAERAGGTVEELDARAAALILQSYLDRTHRGEWYSTI